VLGAPWLDGERLERALATAGLKGVEFRAVEFVPDASKFARERCRGIRIAITDRAALRPIAVGLEIARQLRLLYPRDWNAAYEKLLGNAAVYDALRSGKSVVEMEAVYRPELEKFCERRKRFLLYP
jgi:uncharacterized protein YbbC (DUF1343 family)